MKSYYPLNFEMVFGWSGHVRREEVVTIMMVRSRISMQGTWVSCDHTKNSDKATSIICNHYATTSADEKLLLRLLTFLSPGLSSFVPGTMTLPRLLVLVIHASDPGAPFLGTVADATSFSNAAAAVLFRGTRVGSRDGVGDGGARGRVTRDSGRGGAATAGRGILFIPIRVAGRVGAADAVERSVRVGRCSEAVTPRAGTGLVGTFTFGRAAAAIDGTESNASFSFSSSSTSAGNFRSASFAIRLVCGVLRG